MITLSLLHPVRQVPVQVWTFSDESVVRIGRSTDNQVILYSAVVSRHHVELRRTGASWEIINLGTNGTYLDGKLVQQSAIRDGAVIRLARSGPNIQICMGEVAIRELPEQPEVAQLETHLELPSMIPTEVNPTVPEEQIGLTES